MANKNYTFAEIAQAYSNNINIMKLLRDGDTNSPLAIQVSYDLQTGSYIKRMSDPEYSDMKNRYLEKLIFYIKPYLSDGDSLLEAGTGEATTLVSMLHALPDLKLDVHAFDISWSRLHYARMWLKHHGLSANLFMAGLTNIPLPDNSVDVVLTSHSIEPNRGNEDIILEELYRITRRTLIMFEPTYELADEKSRARMDEMGYCRGLPDIVRKNGWNMTKYELMPIKKDNPTAVIVIEKEVFPDKTASRLHGFTAFTCPMCNSELLKYDGSLFCKNDGVVFPIIRGIPSLLPESAIIASKYTDEEL